MQPTDSIDFGADGHVAPLGAGYWSGVLNAPAWVGLTHAPDAATVEVEIEIPPESANGRPSSAQLAACTWFIQRQAQMVAPVLGAIRDAYPRLQALYDYDTDEAARLMPPIHTEADLLPLIDLRHLYPHDVVNGELPYIGCTFGCTWDAEHGLGVLMHGLRAVVVGDGDVAFDWHAPRHDATQALGPQEQS